MSPEDANESRRERKDFFSELSDIEALPGVSLVQGVVFAFEGTLAHRRFDAEELLNEGARRAEEFLRTSDLELPPEFWKQIVDAWHFAQTKASDEQEEHVADDVIRFLLQFYGISLLESQQDVVQEAVDLLYQPETQAWQLTADALPTLRALRQAGYKIGIIENHMCDRAFQGMISALGLRPMLDLCLTSAAVEYRKPDPKIYEIAVQQWDLVPYELIIVGSDKNRDLAGGAELGAMTVRVAPEHPSVQSAEGPDTTIHVLTELPALISAWSTPSTRSSS